MTTVPIFPLAPDCAYYLVTDSQTHEAIAVVEAGGRTAARRFFVGLRHMLQASAQVDLRVLWSTTLLNEIPVSLRQYLKVLQVNSAEEGQMDDTTRH